MKFKIINAIPDEHIPQLMDLYQEGWWSQKRTEKDVKKMISKTDFIFAVTDFEKKYCMDFREFYQIMCILLSYLI